MTEKAEPDSILQGGIESHSDQHILTTLDGLLEGCQIIGRDFRYLCLNEAMAKQSRASKEKLLGRTMMECYPGIEKRRDIKIYPRLRALPMFAVWATVSRLLYAVFIEISEISFAKMGTV